MADIIKAAGGVVVSGKKILFIKKNGRWEFPKGRLKKGANRKKTAIREICEETGIKKKEIDEQEKAFFHRLEWTGLFQLALTI